MTHEERFERIDKRLADTKRLHRVCAKILAASQRDRRRFRVITNAKINALVDAQMQNEQAMKDRSASLKAYFDSLRKSGNGNSK
jgi:hypothetical protein